VTPTGCADGREAVEAAKRWLADRSEAVPAELAAEVSRLLDEVEVQGAPDPARILAEAGLRGLEDVSSGTAGRETALRLLAADAALTYAFEAAAELGLDVGRLADEVGPSGALGRRLATGRPPGPDEGSGAGPGA
jgi:hypothetical protein